MAGVMFTPSTYGSGESTLADLTEDTGWIDLTLLNGWVNYAVGTYPSAGYRKLNGVVYIRGLLKNGTVTAQTPLANLPVGFRPAYDHMSATAASPGTVMARIDVQATSGNISGMAGLVAAWTSITVVPFIAAPIPEE
jgi:hypothetical protein